MPSWHYEFMIRNVGTQVHQISKVPACFEDGRQSKLQEQLLPPQGSKVQKGNSQPIQTFGDSYSRPFLGLVSQPYFSNQRTELLSHISCIRCQSSLSVLSPLFQPLYIWTVFSLSCLVQLHVSTQRSEVVYCCFSPCSYFNCNLLSSSIGKGKDTYN